MSDEIDILEDNLLNTYGVDVFAALLKDHTMSRGLPEGQQRNIFWATHDYEQLGHGYEYTSPILPQLITGSRSKVIMPRVLKARERQESRSRDMAEVFTPSWICNAQNNLIDAEWFGRKGVFNREITKKDGTHAWASTHGKISFPMGKTWKDYVKDNRLEITCGEAPYIVSRYDSTTGEEISVERRIGFLDRKLRVVNENTITEKEWIHAAKVALMSTYGYEWQGDNLLLAREAVFYTVIDNFKHKFSKPLPKRYAKAFAYIISWNLWQMDGLKCVVPCSCHDEVTNSADMFSGVAATAPCRGCASGDIRLHNGTYCVIRDWHKSFSRPGKGSEFEFVTLVR